MHIRKQRLLTPGPTPLYPPALHAMMASDIHHRTEDFRKVYRSVPRGSQGGDGHRQRRADVCRLRHRRHGRLRFQSVFARRQGDRLRRPGNSASAGPKSPRPMAWTPHVLSVPYGEVVTPAARGSRAGRRARYRGRFRAGFGNLHRRRARRARHGRKPSPRRTPSSWWMPSPDWAPCRSISTAGGSTW